MGSLTVIFGAWCVPTVLIILVWLWAYFWPHKTIPDSALGFTELVIILKAQAAFIAILLGYNFVRMFL